MLGLALSQAHWMLPRPPDGLKAALLGVSCELQYLPRLVCGACFPLRSRAPDCGCSRTAAQSKLLA
jgi:hypothetical protein